MNVKIVSIILLCCGSFVSAIAQSSFSGTITGSEGEALRSASVQVSSLGKGAYSKANGEFSISGVPAGRYEVVVRLVGYRTLRDTLTFESTGEVRKGFSLLPDRLNLDEVVVSATRNTMPKYEAPVVVSTLDSRIFEATQTLSLSEGLAFTPGLRVENNCQNCGFAQVRMNGLDGPYSQILINSRPIYSPLMGVYGLDMLPANMIERVEVIRGAGSVLYGGNAIAGTVNIITKDPVENSFEAGVNYGLTDMREPDRTIFLNGSVVSDDGRQGVSFYAFDRDRAPWDANDDGFSELTKLQNTTFGMSGFYKPSELEKIQLSLFSIREFRRGGSDFDLFPHQSEITEQLDHRILGGTVSYEIASEDGTRLFSIYGSGQTTNRASYYGGGGRVLAPDDEIDEDDILAINAYGNSEDVALVGGMQYSHLFNSMFRLTAGFEAQYNSVNDRMPGYQRIINQKVTTLGAYSQLEIRPTERLTLLAGGRFDNVMIDGEYLFLEDEQIQEKNIGVFVPRISAMYDISPELKARAGFAQGYRAPQAFDEDLHIETVGGAARFVVLDPNLEMERSNSITASLNYTSASPTRQVMLLAEGFYTTLDNAFIIADARELPTGVSVLTKRNGEGAVVMGMNLEAAFALSSNFDIQLGATIQRARYNEDEEIWSPEEVNEGNADSIVTTRNILRTPDMYGFMAANYSPMPRLTLSLSSIFTGPMDVAHVIDPETEFTVIRRTPSFLEFNIKANYTFLLAGGTSLDVFLGVQNIFNSFQDDFDIGAERDASYIYGPMRPRTAFLGMKVGL